MNGASGIQRTQTAERVVPLKHIARLNVATLDESTDPEYAFDYVDISSVLPEVGIVRRERVTFGTAPSRARRKVARGDTIVSTVRTYLRAVAFVDEPDDFVVSTGFAVLSPRPGVDPRYLYRAIQSKSFVDEVVARSTGVSYPAINPSDLGRIGVGMPDAGTQRAIADFLDRETERIDALVAKKQRLIELLQEKRTALISHAVTKGLDPDAPMKDSGIEWLGVVPAAWEVVSLGRHLRRITYGFTNPMPTVDDGPFMLTANDIGDGQILWDTARHTTAEAFSRDLTDKSRPQSGDVLVTKDGSLGRVAVHDGRPTCVNQSVAVLRTRVRLSPYFLSHALRVAPYQSRMVHDAGGTTIRHIYVTRLAKMPIALPPREEQQRIVQHVAQADARTARLQTQVTAAIERFGEYRSALITAAVTGQIDVGAR